MPESSYIHKSHNVSILVYHLVTPAKYRRVIFDKEVEEYLLIICKEIEKRHEINFLEIGVDKDHVYPSRNKNRCEIMLMQLAHHP